MLTIIFHILQSFANTTENSNNNAGDDMTEQERHVKLLEVKGKLMGMVGLCGGHRSHPMGLTGLRWPCGVTMVMYSTLTHMHLEYNRAVQAVYQQAVAGQRN